MKHVMEFQPSAENKRELAMMGWGSAQEALLSRMSESEMYAVKRENEPPLCISGLLYDDEVEHPQMFALFSTEISDNFKTLARGSQMLTNFFDQTHEYLSMSILSEFEPMLHWATWLGFEIVTIAEIDGRTYVDFVRCNPSLHDDSSKSSRPRKH